MALNPSTIQKIDKLKKDVFLDFQASYQAGLKAPANWPIMHMRPINTKKDVVDFPFTGDVNRPTEVLKRERPQAKTATGYEWALPLQFFRDKFFAYQQDLIQEEYGMLIGQAKAFGMKYANNPLYLTVDFLENGTSTTMTYTGDPLFSNTHEIGDSGVFDNLLAGTGDLAVDIQTAYTAMSKFPTDTGDRRPGNQPTHIIHPVDMYFAVKQVLRNSRDAADNKNTENVNMGLVQSIQEGLFTDVNDWYLMRSAPGEEPIVQLRNTALELYGLEPQMLSDRLSIAETGQLFWFIDNVISMNPTHPHLWLKMVNA